MTEDEAKLKRCGGPPGCGTIIEPNSGGMHHNDVSRALNEPNRPRWCVASDCMMWRWNDWKNRKTLIPLKEGGGYCGLAGKP